MRTGRGDCNFRRPKSRRARVGLGLRLVRGCYPRNLCARPSSRWATPSPMNRREFLVKTGLTAAGCAAAGLLPRRLGAQTLPAAAGGVTILSDPGDPVAQDLAGGSNSQQSEGVRIHAFGLHVHEPWQHRNAIDVDVCKAYDAHRLSTGIVRE